MTTYLQALDAEIAALEVGPKSFERRERQGDLRLLKQGYLAAKAEPDPVKQALVEAAKDALAVGDLKKHPLVEKWLRDAVATAEKEAQP